MPEIKDLIKKLNDNGYSNADIMRRTTLSLTYIYSLSRGKKANPSHKAYMEIYNLAKEKGVI